MPTDIVLPNLENWVQQRITALYGATTAADFEGAFDAFIANDVSIKVNGKALSRDEYKKMIQGELVLDAGAQVTFKGVVSVPSDDKSLTAIGTGTVGAFFSALLVEKFNVLGAPESRTVNSSMNVVVIQDSTLHHHQVGRGGVFDARRVTSLNEVFTDEANKITIPPLQPPTATTS